MNSEHQSQTLAQQLGFSAEDADQLCRFGCELASAGQLDDARVMFEGVLTLNPFDAVTRAALGAVLQECGDIEAAERAYGEALAIDPSTPIARLNRGELRLKRGDAGGVDDLRVVADLNTSVGTRARAVLKQRASTGR
ncbi:MAG: tetratricopeptide repeat protein [Archangium sp.]|nr:tetratricopeptide repeat protein [Archangium sp.]